MKTLERCREDVPAPKTATQEKEQLLQEAVTSTCDAGELGTCFGCYHPEDGANVLRRKEPKEGSLRPRHNVPRATSPWIH